MTKLTEFPRRKKKGQFQIKELHFGIGIQVVNVVQLIDYVDILLQIDQHLLHLFQDDRLRIGFAKRKTRQQVFPPRTSSRDELMNWK